MKVGDNISDATEKTEKKQKDKMSAKRESIKLDQIIKILFSLSKVTLINVINGLFNENYDPADVEVSVIKTATEHVKNNLDVIRADLFIQITAQGISRDYHIEFQLSGDNRMTIRMLEYDFQHALDNLRLDDTAELVLRLAKSLVIHFEPSGKIPNKYKIKVEFANGTSGEYEADVMKYWEYSDKALLDKKIYNLLPLELFLLRADFEKATKTNNMQKRELAISGAKKAIEKIISMITDLHGEQKINSDDYNIIITGLSEIVRYLDSKYNLKLEGEFEMIKTIADKTILRRANKAEKALQRAEQAEQRAEQELKKEKERIYKIVKKMLLKNSSIEEIMEMTELTEEEIRAIEKTLH